MKKLFILIAVVIASASVASAQGKWGVGGRVGSGFQAVGEYHFSDKNYVEARFGMAWMWGFNAEFTALYNWRIFTPDWTPGHGSWFFDSGVGLSVGGAVQYAYVGVAGMAKLGYTLENIPLSFTFDWSPIVGPDFGRTAWWGGRTARLAGVTNAGANYRPVRFNAWGLCNFGASVVYRF